MTEEMILQQLKEIFATINPKQDLEKITLDSSLAEDLGLDSLTLLLLSMSIETRFRIRIEQGIQFNRVVDVVNYIAVRNDGK